mgnify:CR=1 FL=1
MLTSFINIVKISALQYDNLTIIEMIRYNLLRFYIFKIEWFIYSCFLLLVVGKKIKTLGFSMLVGTIIIHIHYFFIEIIEEKILNVSQYVSPFHIAMNFFYDC